MTHTQLEYIVALDKYCHFGKAAKACHVSQPTLSMQINKLEEELQVMIFDRSKNPLKVTAEGEVIIRQAKVALRELRKIPDLVDEMKDGPKGSLRLAVIPTMAPYLIPLFASHFAKEYPDVDLSIEAHTTEDILRLLDEDTIDVACMATPLKNDNVIERVLFYEPFSLYASQNSTLYQKEKVAESDLQLKDLWLLTEGHCFRNQVLRFCHMQRSPQGLRHGLAFESGNLETLKNMVNQSGGYTLLPELAVRQLSGENLKQVRHFLDPIPTREVSLVHSRVFLKERLIEALEKVILNSIPKELKSYKGMVLDID